MILLFYWFKVNTKLSNCFVCHLNIYRKMHLKCKQFKVSKLKNEYNMKILSKENLFMYCQCHELSLRWVNKQCVKAVMLQSLVDRMSPHFQLIELKGNVAQSSRIWSWLMNILEGNVMCSLHSSQPSLFSLLSVTFTILNIFKWTGQGFHKVGVDSLWRTNHHHLDQ